MLDSRRKKYCNLLTDPSPTPKFNVAVVFGTSLFLCQLTTLLGTGPVGGKNIATLVIVFVTKCLPPRPPFPPPPKINVEGVSRSHMAPCCSTLILGGRGGGVALSIVFAFLNFFGALDFSIPLNCKSFSDCDVAFLSHVSAPLFLIFFAVLSF